MHGSTASCWGRHSDGITTHNVTTLGYCHIFNQLAECLSEYMMVSAVLGLTFKLKDALYERNNSLEHHHWAPFDQNNNHG